MSVDELRSRVEECVARGAFPQAIETILGARIPFPQVRVGLLGLVGDAAVHCEGVLTADNELRRGIESSLRSARQAQAPWTIERLWQLRLPAHTVAFPILGGDPSILEIRVCFEGDSTLGTRLEPGVVGGVEEALALAVEVLREPRRIAELRVELLPRRADPRQVVGGSLGLAVYLAVASHVLGAELPSDLAATGCIVGGRLVQLSPEDIGGKVAALAQRRQLRRLLIPWPFGVEPPEAPPGSMVETCWDPRDVVERVLRRRLPIHPAARLAGGGYVHLATPEHEELRLRLLAVLVACDDALASDRLEEALHAVADLPRADGFSVARQLGRWLAHREDGPSLRATDGLVQLDGDEARSFAATEAGPRRVRAAHDALASVAESWHGPVQGLALRAWHRWAQGDLAGFAAAVARLARRDEPGRVRALEELAGRIGGVGGPRLVDVAESIPLTAGGGEGSTVSEPGSSPGDPSDPGDALAGSCARLALRCLAAGGLVARLAGPLASAQDPVDRLLAVQAAIEVPMHLAALFVSAASRDLLRGDADPDTAVLTRWLRDLSVRPSIGLFEQALYVLRPVGPSPTSPDDRARAAVQARLGALGKGLGAVDWWQVDAPGERSIAARCNAALHGLGAWAVRLLPGAVTERPHTDKALAGLVASADRLLAEVGPSLAQHPVRPEPADGSTTGGRLGVRPGGAPPLDLHAVLRSLGDCEDAGAIALYRGVVAGRVRYWSYTPASDVRIAAPAPPDRVLESDALGGRSEAPAIVVSFGAAPVSLPARLRPHTLPQPLAALLKALGADAGSRRGGERGVGERLALLDLAVGTWLRLHLFPILDMAGLPPREKDLLLARPTKWKLLECLVSVAERLATDPARSLLLPLRDPAFAARAFDLVDAVQRFEHVPGPLQRLGAEVEGATASFLAVVEESAFGGESPPRLVCAVDAKRFDLTGFGRKGSGKGAGAAGSQAGTAQLQTGGGALPFGDLARLELSGGEARLWLLAERSGEFDLQYTVGERGEYEDRRFHRPRPASGRGKESLAAS